MSVFRFLLLAGGMPLLAFGLILSLWGLWNIFQPRSTFQILSQLVWCSVPGIIAMVAIYLACMDFSEMAAATKPPKPATFAAVAGRAMSFGFFGLMSTIVPMLLGAVAIRRHCSLLTGNPEHNSHS